MYISKELIICNKMPTKCKEICTGFSYEKSTL